MNPHWKSALCAALASVSTLGAVKNATAVNLSTDGGGQVLLYPYYTTRDDGTSNTYSTLISVLNPTANAKAVKVRLLEGKNGRLVFAFNLFLSPFDYWTAVVLKDTKLGARIGTTDTSCTLPAFATSQTAPFFSLSDAFYTGAADDGGGMSLDRTREGYIEVIEMATYTPSSTTGVAVTHVNGVPPCGSNLTHSQATVDAQPPSGGLFGSTTLINVNASTEYTLDPLLLGNFSTTAIYQSSGSSLPDLTGASPPQSRIVAPNGSMYISTWSSGTADPVSALLMHNSVMNEYVRDTATKSGTDWVVTFPTKRFYVSQGAGNAPKLFQRNFNGTVGSCDDVSLSLWDREEQAPAASPPSLCWASNVITFNNTNVLSSANVAGISSSYEHGWGQLGFPTGISGAAAAVHKLINAGQTSITTSGGGTTTGNTITYVGLPMIGYAVTSFNNGVITGGAPPTAVLSSYGNNLSHKTNTLIQ